MTSTAPINGLLVAGGVVVAAAIWAGAIFLPAPTVRGARPQPLPQPVLMAPTAAHEAAPEIRQQQTAVASAPIDPAIFGALQMSMEPPAPPQRVSILNAAGSLPLTSMSLASTPLQTIGATFAEPAAGLGLPELGGAASLDGPADSGLDLPVARSDEAEIASASGPPPPRGKIIVIDASEGTKIDPLRQRNWDLNAAQVIPAMPTSAPPKR